MALIDETATARGAALAGQQRAQPLQRGDRAEEVQLQHGLGRAAAGVGDHRVDGPAGKPRHAIGKRGAAGLGRQVGDHVRIVQVASDHAGAAFAQPSRGRARRSPTPIR